MDFAAVTLLILFKIFNVLIVPMQIEIVCGCLFIKKLSICSISNMGHCLLEIDTDSFNIGIVVSFFFKRTRMLKKLRRFV